MATSGEHKTSCLRATVSALKTARREGVINGEKLSRALQLGEDFQKDHFSPDGELQLSLDGLYDALFHSDSRIRLEALDIFCASNRLSELPTATELNVLMKVLPFHFKMQTSAVRDSFTHLLQRLLLRMRYACRKCVTESRRAEDAPAKIQHCLDFLGW
eukprot:417869_1